MIGQGNVLLHQASFTTTSSIGVKVMKATIAIDIASVPRVKVLGVIAREDGELVADIIELPVKCQLEHQVRWGGGGGGRGIMKGRKTESNHHLWRCTCMYTHLADRDSCIRMDATGQEECWVKSQCISYPPSHMHVYVHIG